MQQTSLFDNILDDPSFDYAKETSVKCGDIYMLGNHRLMCGDATKKEDVEKLMKGAKADMILTDPPYNVDYTGTAGKIQNDKQKDKEFSNFLNDAFRNMSEVAKAGAPIYVFHADVESSNFLKAFKEADFKLASILIWVKNNFVFGRKDYHSRHEPFLYGWKNGGAHYFVDDRTQDTIWEYDKPKSNDLHPTMKPVQILTRAIKNSSKKGEIVFDPFGGSGSTLIACEQLERNCYMMELDEKYAQTIINRWRVLTKGNVIKL